MTNYIDQEGYIRLCVAVLKQAEKDYTSALQDLKKNPDDIEAKKLAKDCIDFYCSEVFDLYSDDDGPSVERKIRKKVVQHV